MARPRSSSKGPKKKKSIVVTPPPPPPTLIRLDTPDDFRAHVTCFNGSALLAVVSPLCSASTNTVVPFLEKLNNDRPSLLKETNLLVLYAMDTTDELCEQLQISTVPAFFAYSYGELVHSFQGDNTAKAELIAKIAAQKAQDETARLEAEKAIQEQVATT